MSVIVDSLAHTYVLAWVVASVAARLRGIELAKTVAAELRPLFLPALVVGYWLTGQPLDFWNLIWFISSVAAYAMYRDDDDRWKRRRKKLAEKIARKGSRLVVVPAGAR